MGFEAKVMTVVEEVLGESIVNGFAYGTLFVCCEAQEATALKRQLSKEFGKVQVTPQSGYMEYAFDFVA